MQDYCTIIGTSVEIRVEYRTNGAFNLVVFVDVSSNLINEILVLRVPVNGTEAHWTPEIAYVLEREVHRAHPQQHLRSSANDPSIFDQA